MFPSLTVFLPTPFLFYCFSSCRSLSEFPIQTQSLTSNKLTHICAITRAPPLQYHYQSAPRSSSGTWKWVIITRTAAPSPLSGIHVPILRTTQSLRTCPCQHASDHAATATWEPSRPAVPRTTTRRPWTRAARRPWLTPPFAPTAPAQVSHSPTERVAGFSADYHI